MKKHNALLLLFFLLFYETAFCKSLSIYEFLDEVQKANLNLQASKLRSLSFKHQIDPSGTLDDPFIAGGLDDIPFEGGKAKVRRYQISQTFPFPGKLKARKGVAEERANVSLSDTETMLRQIKVIGIQSFLRAIYNQEAIKLNERIQKIVRESTLSAKSRYKTGSPSHHEWLLGKLELSMLEVENLRLKRFQTTLYALLNELRNLPPDALIEIELDESVFNKISLPEVRLEEQPELKAFRFEEARINSQLKLARLSYAPDFVVQGMAMEPTSSGRAMGAESNWGVMVGITVPLFFWRKQSELVAAAEKDRLAVMADVRALQNRLNTEIAEARQQLETSLDVVSLYKKDVIPLTNLAVNNARSSYATRTLGLVPLLDALKSHRTQELEFLAAKMDAFVAKTRLEELLSTPPVTRFAPARPTLFGGGGMTMGEDTMRGSATVNMGDVMSGPTRKQSSGTKSETGMGGMGGM